jgi:hypothetical protein
MKKVRAVIAWIRARRAARVERDVAAAAERQRGSAAFDPSQGEIRPQQDPGNYL